MKKLILVFIFTISLFAVEKATFPNDDMNVIISGVFLDDSSYESNQDYIKFGNAILKTIRDFKYNKDSIDGVKKLSFKLKNSKELSIFSIAEDNEYYKDKLVNALSDELKPNTLKIGIKYIPDDKYLKLQFYRVYNENIDKIPLVEFFTIKFNKNVNYENVVKYLILSDFQDFNTKIRKIVPPVTILPKEGQYILNYYINNSDKQKYFNQDVKSRNLELLNKLGLAKIDYSSSFFSHKAEVTFANAKKYCSIYNMKLPDLSLINQLGIQSFSKTGIYELDNPILKIFTPTSDDKSYFFCSGRSVKLTSTQKIDKTTLPEDKWPKIFAPKEIDLMNVKYEED